MDYKVKYEQALERCKKEFNFNNLTYSHEEIKQRLERVFPELKENRDEEIRKMLIERMERLYEWAIAKNAVQAIKDSADAITWLKKQGEQKPTDKVEPKFKVGDWVVCYYHKSVNQITQVEKLDEIFSYTLDNGAHFSSHFENDYHHWTIQDAKAGDVLVTPNNNIFIFKEIRNPYQVFDHCGLYFDSLTVESSCVNGIFSEELPNDYKLATKEQRDLLFQYIKEAGYEWDDEKKELKKIEQKSNWSEEDEAHVKSLCKRLKGLCRREFVTTRFAINEDEEWLKSIKKRLK